MKMSKYLYYTTCLTLAVCLLLLSLAGCQEQPTGSSEPGDRVSSSITESSDPNAIESTSENSNDSSVSSPHNTYEDFQYEIVEGKAIIVKYLGHAEHVEIPETINDVPVQCIGYHAFDNNTTMVTIDIPDSVTEIYSSAFSGCSSLTSVELPKNLLTLGGSAFADCTSLISVWIPKSIITWGSHAFNYCTALTKVEFEKGLQIIGEAAFVKCTSLTSITIPEGVVSIESSAFLGTPLTSVIIPKSVRSMDDSFNGCKKLESVKFEGDPPNIDSYSFSGSDNVILYYHAGNTSWTSALYKGMYKGYPTKTW